MGKLIGIKDFWSNFNLINKTILKKIVYGLSLGIAIWLSMLAYSLSVSAFVAVILLVSEVYRALYFRDVCKSRLTEDTEEFVVNQLLSSPSRLFSILGKPLIYPIIFIMSIVLLARSTEVSISALISGLDNGLTIMSGIFSPNWSLLPDAVTIYARQTFEVALLGTLFCALLALPISFLCSRNIMSNSVFLMTCYYLFRSVVAIIRATPVFLIGLVFVAIVGLGIFPGVLAITLFSLGINVKLFSEAIEGVDQVYIDAIYAVGADRWQVTLFGVIPQVIPSFIASILYCAEINIHSATVLGLIGAQGIGLPIHEYVSTFAFKEASVFIIVVIVMTMVIDFGSGALRSKLK